MTQPVPSQTSATPWTLIIVGCDLVSPKVLKNPIKFSDFVATDNQNFVFKDMERDFVIDLDVRQKTIDIVARSILVMPKTTVNAEKIEFRAPHGYFNLGRMNYTFMETWAPKHYSGAEGELLPGNGSRAINHL